MKGIILAGGLGTRLYPITKTISKHLLPVYNKPMIYYPLSILIKSGIKEILIISTPNDLPLYKNLLGNGKELGCRFFYESQENPKGISEAFIIGKSFLNGADVMLILGDNIFYNFTSLKEVKLEKTLNKSIIFAYKVKNPSRYGIVTFSKKGEIKSIEEKPENPKSNYAIPGIYIYPGDVIEKVSKLKYSKRGELEITDLNNIYLKENRLTVLKMNEESIWLDAGTFSSLLEASQFVEALENRQGILIGSIEQAAFEAGFINKQEFLKLAKSYNQNSGYGNILIEKSYE